MKRLVFTVLLLQLMYSEGQYIIYPTIPYVTTDPYPRTTDPYVTTDPDPPTTDPYVTTDPYPRTTDPYVTTDPYPRTTDPYVTTDPYPYYDPYEPYDPYDPYPNYLCDQNEDEYGRPYFGPYDQYRRPDQQYPPRPYPPITPGYSPTTRPPYPPTTRPPYPPTTRPPYPPTTQPPYPPTTRPPYPPTTRPPYPPTTQPPYLPATEYVRNLETVIGQKKRQVPVYTLPSCITRNECNRQPETCTGYGTQYDSCGRRCTCRNGRLNNCCRVRKEWRSMTQAERCRYVTVLYTASTTQPWKRCYDELIRIHRDQFSTGIHNQPFFLPWHRWYILALENLLRDIDCNITVPYWDWSLESRTWQNSIVWAAQCGLGGNGDPSNNNHVSSGEFRQGNWLLAPSANGNTGGFLRRAFNGVLPDCASVATTQRMGLPEFDTWHTFVSSNLHDAVHCNIGGTMCSRDSANAPEFFLHHGFIDKIWADWQNKGPEYKNLAYYAQNAAAMQGTFGYSPRNLYDLNNQPGCVRVCIEPSARPCRLNTTYTPVCPREMSCSEYSPLKLAYLIPRPYPNVSQASFDLFKTPYEIRQASDRFSTLYSDFDELYKVLQSNGYDSGSAQIYRHPRGELQFDRYIYQPPAPPYVVYPTANPDYLPPECRPYFQKYTA